MRLAGEIAVGVAPSLRGFKAKATSQFKAMRMSFDVPLNPDFKRANAELAAFRRRQEANAINIRVDVDRRPLLQFEKDFRRIEHVYKTSPLRKAIRVQVVVAGAAALPGLTQGALSATTALTRLAQAGLVLPGVFAGLAASVGTALIGLRGISDAMSAASDRTKDAAQKQQDYNRATRDLSRAQRDMVQAVKDANREIEDQQFKLKNGVLTVERAQNNIRRANERLARGGFESMTDYRDAIIDQRQAYLDLEMAVKEQSRATQDYYDNAAKGARQTDTFKDALDRLSTATEDFSKAQREASGLTDEFLQAMAKLSPAGQDLVNKLQALTPAWQNFANAVSQKLLVGVGDAITDLANKRLPMLQEGMGKVASALNEQFKGLLETLGSDANATRLESIFSNTATALRTATPGLQRFVDGILQLAEVGGRFLPRLAGAFNQVADRFANFIDRADRDGSLERWIDKGLNALTDLGRAAGHVVSIFNGLSEAYEKATGNLGGLTNSMERGLGRLADWINSPQGQDAVVGFIHQAQGFIKSIKDALPGIWDLFQTVGDALRDFAQVVFPIFSAVNNFVKEHETLVRTMLAAYLAWRGLLSPIFNTMRSGWDMANKRVERFREQQVVLQALAKEQARLTQAQQAAALRLKDVEQKAAADKERALRLRKLAEVGVLQAQGAQIVMADKVAAKEKTVDKVRGMRVEAAQIGQLTRLQEGHAIATQLVADAKEEEQRAVRNLTAVQAQGSTRIREARAEYERLGGQLRGVSGSMDELQRGPMARLRDGMRNSVSWTGNLVKSLGGLASVLGGLGGTAALIVGMKLWEDANQRAGDRVGYHLSQLQALKNELDDTTGAVTEAGKTQALREAQGFQVTGNKGQITVDALAAAGRLGISRDQLAASTDPTQVQAVNDVQSKADQDVIAAVRGGKDEQWNRYGAELKKYGVTEEVYAKAIAGDPESTAKFEAAAEKFFRSKGDVTGTGRFVPDSVRINLGRGAENLINQGVAGVSVGQFARSSEAGNRAGGDQIKASNQAVQLNPAGQAVFPGAQDIYTTDRNSVGLVMNNLTPEQVRAITEKTGAQATALAVGPDGKGRYSFSVNSDLQKWFVGFKHGGEVWGAGSATSDSIPALLSNGEFVVNAKSAGMYGADMMHAINEGNFPKFAVGGSVDTRWNPLLTNPSQPYSISAAPIPLSASGSAGANIPSAGAISKPWQQGVGQSVLDAGRTVGGALGVYGNTGPNNGIGRTGDSVLGGALGSLGLLPQGDTTGYKYGNQSPNYDGPNRSLIIQRALRPDPVILTTPPPPAYVPPRHGTGASPGTGNGIPHTTPGASASPGGSNSGTPAVPGVVSAAGPASRVPTFDQLGSGIPATAGGAYVPKFGGNGALPDQGATGNAAAPNAPINPDANILDYLRQVGKEWGLFEGTSTFRPDEPNSQHAVGRAIDLGGGDPAWSDPAKIEAFVQSWMADPEKVASTRQLIFAAPSGRKYGIINGRALSDEEAAQVYGGGNMGGHADHVHLALEGVPLEAIMPGGGGAPLGGAAPGVVPPALAGPGAPPLNAPAPGAAPVVPGLNAPIPGPFGDIPFNGLDFLGDIGKIILQAIGSFFGIDLAKIFGWGQSIIEGVTGNGVGGAAPPPGDIPLPGDPGADQNVINDLVAQAEEAKRAGNRELAESLLQSARDYESRGGATTPVGPSTLGSLTPESNKDQIAQAILSEAKARGYSRDQAQAILSTALQESGLNPSIPGGGGAWIGIFQQDTSYPGRSDPNQNIGEFFNRLGSKGGPASEDIWKSIFWLQQRPGEASAANAFANGRQAYLSEIMSQSGAAAAFIDKFGYSHGGDVRGPGSGTSDSIPALLSNGEFVMRAAAVKKYGGGFMEAINSGKIARANTGGLIINPLMPQSTPPPGGHGPLPMAPTTPPPGQPSAAPGVGAGAAPGAMSPPSATPPPPIGGGALAGATMNGEGLLNAKEGASGWGSALGSGIAGALAAKGAGSFQMPGSTRAAPGGKEKRDNRGMLGEAPQNLDHTLPALSKGIQGAASTIGSIASTAASIGGNMVAPGAGSAIGAGIQAGAQMAGQVATGAANIISSLLVGTVTGGTTGQGYGAPLSVPAGEKSPVRSFQMVQNGDIYTNNLDEYQRLQDRKQAQAAGPFLGRFG